MVAFKLAYKNLIGAGLRTWLNVSVLSLAFVMTIFYNGMIDGWNRQGRNDTQDWEIANGQYWHPEYDRLDVFSIKDSHQPLSAELQQQVSDGWLVPQFIQQASIYPQGRMQSVLLKGIPHDQTILKIPTAPLKTDGDELKAIIGKRMAESTHLKVGDQVLIRWRDKNGTFDALELTIVSVFQCDVPGIDNGQIYIDYDRMQEMMGLENNASLLVTAAEEPRAISGWSFKDTDFLLADLDKMIESKKGGGIVLQGVLLLIALLAIFDTQVLSIFRRQKEIGTYIALGLTRSQVVGIFTIEGGAHSILAALVGAAYGIPFFLYLDTVGLSFGSVDVGVTIAETIYPYYSLGLILSTMLLVVVSATIVSYLPARRIAKMNPTEALKGKIQ
ncbi:ABC transporter permease [Carboxylicivirga sp. M1479]|uniref:ABC transporter permease n=1 Tax=Carboxylicivirga sp. M1479 TaxID=2594476 RepID=UPI001177F17C|nr:FtsX-like permease family protein [Carboxylicivirga sp. M1479]TRX70413.1 ABC transporter permease [Carboxylicivirga sp. M1479]